MLHKWNTIREQNIKFYINIILLIILIYINLIHWEILGLLIIIIPRILYLRTYNVLSGKPTLGFAWLVTLQTQAIK